MLDSAPVGGVKFGMHTVALTAHSAWGQAVDRAVAEEGWQMVLLLRLAPVVPFAALNYVRTQCALYARLRILCMNKCVCYMRLSYALAPHVKSKYSEYNLTCTHFLATQIFLMLSRLSVTVRGSQQSLRMCLARFMFRKGAGRNLRGLLVIHLGQRAGHHPG